MSKQRLFFPALFAALAASRLCHSGILWEGDALPLASAAQMLGGKTIYRDIWFDKPPLTPAFYLLCGARAGWLLRVEDALYVLLCCWVVSAFARDLWSRREGFAAAGLLAFYLIFYFPSAVIPAASDLLMLAPHVAAVWLAHKRRPFWSGALAGVAFWISPKGVFVAAACLLWNPAGAPLMAGGFLAVSGVAAAWLWNCGALGPYWDEVWRWGRIYAAGTPVAEPVKNGILRTLNWMAFHAAACAAAAWFLAREAAAWRAGGKSRATVRWAGWAAISMVGVAAGMRFFPRYFFLLLPPVVLMAARGFCLARWSAPPGLSARARAVALRPALVLTLLLLVPVVRFAPGYPAALSGGRWRDTDLDRNSRTAAAILRQFSRKGDTLFVWGYRPEIYVYAGLPAATRFLDSQPLTGVPADRHLTQSKPVEPAETTGKRRAELTASRPVFIADGLSAYNSQLGITTYPDLQAWLAGYRVVGRAGGTVIYRLEQ